jgi:nucleotide-binding universal stress UspA family protein
VPFARILVVIDGRPGGQRVLETAIELARALDADLEVIAVEGPLPASARHHR